MAGVDRVTITLPSELVREMERREKNRSKFIAEAVRNELERRRRDELHRSLANPHPESAGCLPTGEHARIAEVAIADGTRAFGGPGDRVNADGDNAFRPSPAGGRHLPHH